MMSLFRDPAQLSGADARKGRPRSVEWSPARFACAVFTHVECAVRYWPTEREGPFNPRMLEDAFPMRDVAGSGRALELNIDSPYGHGSSAVVEQERWPASRPRAMRTPQTPWPAPSTKQWQWPSTSASAQSSPRGLLDPLIVLSSGWLSELDLWRTATMAGSRCLLDLALGYAYRCSGANSGVSEKWPMSRAEAPVH